MIINKRVVALVCFIFSICLLRAQYNYVQITIPVRDALAKNSLNNDRHRVAFEICNPVDSAEIAQSVPVFSPGVDPSAMMDSPGGEYLLKVTVYDTVRSADGRIEKSLSSVYEPISWHKVTIPAGGNQITLAPIYISLKRQKKLDEVTVTASKVMFYHKGDTLIYNADAFVLPQGSMLDALIEQLPGVNISSTGVIYCNGRRIDNLLLNGRDLFNGNQKLMLENLGAYTVKDIAVYDKKGHLSEMFAKNMGDMLHVMDVRLKREYQQGYILNLEGGYGTKERYLARLFGMWFIENLSVTAYGNVNNMDDRGTPGRDDSAWSYGRSGTGVASTQKGGLSYFYQGSDSKLELKGDVGIEHSDRLSTTSTSSQSYFSTGDVYSYAHNHKNSRDLSVKTSHNLFLKAGERVMVNFSPKFQYLRKKDDEQGLDVNLNDELQDFSMDLLESIYEDASAYRTTVINRSRINNRNVGNNIGGSAEVKTDIKLNSANQQPWLLSLTESASLNRTHYDYFSKYSIKAEADNSPYFDENRYIKGYPTRDEVYKGSAELSKWLTYGGFNGTLKFNYTFDRTNSKETSAMYMLNLIPGYEGFGNLPSVAEYLPTYSPMNSYQTSAEYNHHHVEVKLESSRNLPPAGNLLTFWTSLPIDIYDRNLVYDGRGAYKEIKRKDYIVNGWVGGRYFLPHGRSYLQFGLTTECSPTNMMNLVAVKDDTDPLNIFTGNSDLRNQRKYSANILFNKDKITSHHNIYLDWQTVSNAIALGYLYNPESGVRSGRMLNIDGNWQANGYYEFDTHFGSFSKPQLSTKTSGAYQRSVDFFGTTTQNNSSDIPLRSVNTITVKEDVRLDWQTGKHRFSAFGDVRFNRYMSKDRGFANFTSWNYNVGASAVINLPYDWGFSTDLVLHGRRGYTDSRLNTTDLVWNARLTKSILKGTIIFIADGFDLLHQLSNINYTVNAQARTETVTNVIPSYLLFHIRWNFNKSPLRKQSPARGGGVVIG